MSIASSSQVKPALCRSAMCLHARNISLRWSEPVLLGSCFYKHFAPPGLTTDHCLFTPTLRNTTLQTRHQLAQIHFCLSRLEAAFHRGLHASLVLGSAHTLEEKIGVALNVFGRSESDCVDSILDHRVTRGWKTANPKR